MKNMIIILCLFLAQGTLYAYGYEYDPSTLPSERAMQEIETLGELPSEQAWAEIEAMSGRRDLRAGPPGGGSGGGGAVGVSLGSPSMWQIVVLTGVCCLLKKRKTVGKTVRKSFKSLITKKMLISYENF